MELVRVTFCCLRESAGAIARVPGAQPPHLLAAGAWSRWRMQRSSWQVWRQHRKVVTKLWKVKSYHPLPTEALLLGLGGHPVPRAQPLLHPISTDRGVDWTEQKKLSLKFSGYWYIGYSETVYDCTAVLYCTISVYVSGYLSRCHLRIPCWSILLLFYSIWRIILNGIEKFIFCKLFEKDIQNEKKYTDMRM